MAKREFTYKGRTLGELQKLSLNELAEILPSRQRRKIKRGLTEEEKRFLKKFNKGIKNIETHCRTMIVLPAMVGSTIKIHRGNSFEAIMIQPEMIGHYFGEFALTRKRVAHSAPGIGATKSSAALSVK